MLEEYGDILARKRTVTTRPVREGNEKSKENFLFVTPESFQTMVQNNEFIEYRERSEGCWYGTSRAELDKIKSENKIPIIEVDVQGAKEINR